MLSAKLTNMGYSRFIQRLTLLFLGLLLAACRAEGPPAASPESTTTAATATAGPIVAEPAGPVTTHSPLPTVPAGNRLPDELANQFLFDLSGGQPSAADEARQTILESGDARFIAAFLELMRARQIGIVGGSYEGYIEALEALSGQEFGDDWPAWVEWYGRTELVPPPGFTSWKGLLLGRIDPQFDNFLRDEYPSRIRVEEILWGGVGVDGIPPLENAPMIPGREADYLLDDEPVFGLEINGEARAYPLRIIDNHEMANDTIGGVPVSIAYCTLCGAAVAYDGRGPDNQTYTFGTSGFLYRSNKLMYDRLTETLWNQLTGRPVLGELADSDIQLDTLPIVLATWADWLRQHPDTLVLDRDTGIYPASFYEPGVLYGGYFASDGTMFPVWQRSDALPDKAFVYTLFLDGQPKAYSVDALAEAKVVNDTLGQTAVVLIAPNDPVTVSGEDRRLGSVTYTNGAEVRAYERSEELFLPGPEPGSIADSQGGVWQVTEQALIGPAGRELPRLPGHLAYWFGWYAFFPDTLLFPAGQ